MFVYYDEMKESYKELGFPKSVQVWDPFLRQLVTETYWFDPEPVIPGLLHPVLDSQLS